MVFEFSEWESGLLEVCRERPKLFRKVWWEKIRVRLDLQTVCQSKIWKADLNPDWNWIPVRTSILQRVITSASEVQIRWFKSLNSSTLPGLQLSWRAQVKIRSLSDSKTAHKVQHNFWKFCYLPLCCKNCYISSGSRGELKGRRLVNQYQFWKKENNLEFYYRILLKLGYCVILILF